jgi:class 3 adenylate cyclase
MVAVLETHKISISEAYLIAHDNDTALIEENELNADWYSSYLTSDEDPMEPVSDIYFPILDDAADQLHEHVDHYKTSDHKLGGFLAASIYWRDLIKGILPVGSNGMILVFESSGGCNPSFTYQIDGPDAIFLGTGDFHEPQYDHLEISEFLIDLYKYQVQERIYTGVPVNEDYCPFLIRVFPSTTMKNLYVTNGPEIYCLVAICIFVFTSGIFIIYDCSVEHRQKVVMRSANKSNAIVTSLFPGNVVDRLYDSQEILKRETAEDINDGASYDSRFSRRESTVSLTSLLPSLPIADHFPETTVLFADVAGFTSWCDTREPSQVFTLLETLYAAFDKIAKRRGVFKIETIGDCYVAVCGLPTPRKHHATAMCLFAAECREVMNSLTSGELEFELGPGTSNLMLRTGIHSGPVTAGVLRGQKARFQLFGDTVNTAARMESNGKPDWIHCSQNAAELIIKAGKGAWLRKRIDTIEAKGKGKMQTYWVTPKLKRFESGKIDYHDALEDEMESSSRHTTGSETENKGKKEQFFGVEPQLSSFAYGDIGRHDSDSSGEFGHEKLDELALAGQPADLELAFQTNRDECPEAPDLERIEL